MRKGDVMLITPSGKDKGSLSADDIAEVRISTGENLTPEKRLSIETGMHRLIYLSRPDAGAVVHSHPVFASLFSASPERIDTCIIAESWYLLGEVEKICADTEETAWVTQGARHIMFKVGDTMLVSRRLEGEFLAYRQAIPRNNAIHVEGDTRTLQASIDRVSLIISDKLKSPLRCVFADNVLRITTKTAIGDAADQCPIDGDGGGLEIGFNNKYLMDALKAAPADRVRIELSSGVSPCVILPTGEGEEHFLYMVLPVRLKAGE